MMGARMFWRDRWQGMAILIVLVAFFVAVARAGTPPPPYTSGSANLATVNALGGIGRINGYVRSLSYGAGPGTSVDLLNLTTITTANATAGAELGTAAVASAIREVTVRRVADNSKTIAAVCVQLGPDETTPIFCPDTNVFGIVPYGTGGCYLTQTGDQCTFSLRPITAVTGGCSTTGSSTCLPKLWASGSADTSAQGVLVSVTWAW